MQNIDYSRRLRPSAVSSNPPVFSSPTTSLPISLPKLSSPLFLVIGAILLFTAGMVVGIQLSQKEQTFQEKQERSFANLGKKTNKGSIAQEPQDSKPKIDSNSSESSSSDSSLAGFATGLKFPPKNDQINYMVQIGDFSPEEANQTGKKLVSAEESLKGRIFRTSTGKLYAGYFYKMEDAKEALERIRKSSPELSEASVKTIRF